jgi:hypothetical protein
MSDNNNKDELQQQGDVLSKVKGDPILAERLRCGGCQRALNQVPDYELVEIPNRKRASDPETTAAKGFLCSDCQKDPARSKEGPRQAAYIDTFGDIRIDFYDNLIDTSKPEAATTTAATVATAKEGEQDKTSPAGTAPGTTSTTTATGTTTTTKRK